MQRTMMRCAAALVTLTFATTAFALGREAIEAEVNTKQDELSSCYENAVTRNPDLKKGKIITRYHVTKEGKVDSAKILRNDLRDNQLGECVRQVFLTLDYGELEKPTNVTYPLDFN
jgi:hypothetical protein